MSRTTVERHLVNAQLCLLSTYDGHLDDATAYVTKALGALFDLKNQLGRSSEPASSPAGLLSGGRPVVPEEGQR